MKGIRDRVSGESKSESSLSRFWIWIYFFELNVILHKKNNGENKGNP